MLRNVSVQRILVLVPEQVLETAYVAVHHDVLADLDVARVLILFLEAPIVTALVVAGEKQRLEVTPPVPEETPKNVQPAAVMRSAWTASAMASLIGPCRILVRAHKEDPPVVEVVGLQRPLAVLSRVAVAVELDQ